MNDLIANIIMAGIMTFVLIIDFGYIWDTLKRILLN